MIDETLFPTITARHWADSLLRARMEPNQIRAQISAAVERLACLGQTKPSLSSASLSSCAPTTYTPEERRTNMNFPIKGVPLANAVAQMERCMRTAAGGALMADHHLGYSVPIGGVLAYKNAINPSGVGYDTGCGNKAVLTTLTMNDARGQMSTWMDKVWQ